MVRGSQAALSGRSGRFSLQAFIRKQLLALCGLALFLGLAWAVAALATWNVADPSFSYATGNPPTNLMGYAGAAFADIIMQFLGLSGLIAMLPVLAWALAMITGRRIHRLAHRAAAFAGGAILAAAVFGCFPPPLTWPIPNGIGGVIGDMILRFPGLFIGAYPTGLFAMVLGTLMALPTLWLMLYAAGFVGNAEPEDEEIVQEDDGPVMPVGRLRKAASVEPDEDDEGFFAGFLALGAVTHHWYTAQARLRRLFGIQPKSRAGRSYDEPYDFNDDEFGTLNEPVRPKQKAAEPGLRIEPSLDGPSSDRPAPRRQVEPPSMAADDPDEDDDAPFDLGPPPAGILMDEPAGRLTRPLRGPAARAESIEPRPVAAGISSRGEVRPAGRSQHGQDSDGFALPALDLLAEPKSIARDQTLSADALESNARMLEGVLEDFGVKGEIIHVRPGPVVTLYELEPAPGIKSSRVIGLADDIARSMSAIAARVAVVPGRNAIGIELPNQLRETVYLRELLASRDFDGSKAKLGMALGKTIGGEAVIADLAKMPHLLVAGTTGSGKSVAINTMILSLLYRMTPEQCRLIMIDPKMLELSVYDGIPHLLSPVVTDPKKAVVALKWTVREMEDRYKKMSKIGVRNIDGFNSRVEQALAKGEAITRTVQTGFDRETGEAIYETEEFDLQPMPYIVVIIDEMADLMMVAGKDIEGAVQRLAQMARAAGIHVIMATQRPSVDVITGTIKANFPTRISFQVTSKIDSRTILGEQGAEQLLGMGDMLYMAGGGRIQRVHGPFVSDVEVEDVVAHLKMQGSPQYLEAITADDDDEGGSGGPAGTQAMADSEDPYDQAVAIVLRDGKASTSYIQRRLGIGYNRAASLIERMEREGVISPANHAGKREILVPTEADIIER